MLPKDLIESVRVLPPNGLEDGAREWGIRILPPVNADFFLASITPGFAGVSYPLSSVPILP
jgi:hypothetical protein